VDTKELIWVPKDVAVKYNKAESEKNKTDEHIKVIDEFIEKLCESSRSEFKANLEAMEEDVAIYSGLMLKVKQSFTKAKDEALASSYEIWEKFDTERLSVSKKISGIISELQPLKNELNELNKLLGQISTYNIDKLRESISLLSNMYGQNKEMVEFLIKNFPNSKV
jgi:uncharacterized coiled-coil DUF342 family protein